MRSELLPALPPGGPDAAADRYVHIPPRLSLRFPSRALVTGTERRGQTNSITLAAFDHVELVDDAGVDAVVPEDVIDL